MFVAGALLAAGGAAGCSDPGDGPSGVPSDGSVDAQQSEGAVVATGVCGVTAEEYCASHPCLPNVEPGPDFNGHNAAAAYCADPVLSKCVTGSAWCEPLAGAGPAYVMVELSLCQSPVVAYYDPVTGDLVSVRSLDDAGCQPSIDLHGVTCVGTGVICSLSKMDAGADAQPDDGS